MVPLRLPLIPSLPRNTLGINTDALPSLYPSATRSNNIYVHRLKNKIGTHPVPTAELSLNGAKGYLIGSLNEGVKTISPVLNITRLHSAILSVSNLSRCLQIARSYASVRTISSSAGGDTLLRDLPLHTFTLAKVAVLYRALTHLTFGVVCLLGRSENGNATMEENAMLRLLTPVAKGFVASYAVGGMEECMIALGGQGYMEETGIGRQAIPQFPSQCQSDYSCNTLFMLHRMIRDASVEKIWEGTANVLALDVIRACTGGRAMNAFSSVSWGGRHVSRQARSLY
jgi:alkylation response protein AidB-like acyl-CoA dehydrogenase